MQLHTTIAYERIFSYLSARAKEMGRATSRVTMKKWHLSETTMTETAVYKLRKKYFLHRSLSQCKLFQAKNHVGLLIIDYCTAQDYNTYDLASFLVDESVGNI